MHTRSLGSPHPHPSTNLSTGASATQPRMAPAGHLATATLAATAAVVALLLLAGGRGAEAGADTSDCRVAQTAFGDCTDYVAGLEGAFASPPRRCCQALRTISDLSTTREQRRELCECVLSVIVAAGNVNPHYVQMLRYGAACSSRADFLPPPYYNEYGCSRIR